MATFAAGKSSLILAKSSNILRYSSVGFCGLSYQRIHAVCRNNFPNYPYTQFVRLIQSQETPNPNSIKLLVGRVILSKGAIDFPNVRSADKSPLAKKLFDISGVKGVYFGHDFVTVTKDNEDLDWQNLKPQIIDAIKDFLSSGLPVLSDDVKISDEESLLHEKEDETVLLIKELIETRIRPTVQDDGGDIVFKGFEEGVVKVKLQGSCTSCPSSSVTLKRGVQNMLQFYVPEVMGVLQVEDEEDDMSKQEFERFEKSLEEQKTVK